MTLDERRVADERVFVGFRGNRSGPETSASAMNPSANMTTSGHPTVRAGNLNAAMSADGMFATIPAHEELSSKVVRLDFYNNANQSIGKIKDTVSDTNGVRAYIVAVGGCLGMGDRYVAVTPSAVNISYEAVSGRKRRQG